MLECVCEKGWGGGVSWCTLLTCNLCSIVSSRLFNTSVSWQHTQRCQTHKGIHLIYSSLSLSHCSFLEASIQQFSANLLHISASNSWWYPGNRHQTPGSLLPTFCEVMGSWDVGVDIQAKTPLSSAHSQLFPHHTRECRDRNTHSQTQSEVIF